MDPRASVYSRIYAWWVLVQTWCTLHFSDHRGISPQEVKIDSSGSRLSRMLDGASERSLRQDSPTEDSQHAADSRATHRDKERRPPWRGGDISGSRRVLDKQRHAEAERLACLRTGKLEQLGQERDVRGSPSGTTGSRGRPGQSDSRLRDGPPRTEFKAGQETQGAEHSFRNSWREPSREEVRVEKSLCSRFLRLRIKQEKDSGVAFAGSVVQRARCRLLRVRAHGSRHAER